MKKVQTVSITIVYDPTQCDDPKYWQWDELIDTAEGRFEIESIDAEEPVTLDEV